MRNIFICIVLVSLLSWPGCKGKDSGQGAATANEVECWLTRGDQSVVFQKQAASPVFDTLANVYPVITIDTTQTFQSIDGFGFTLTTGSAVLINRLATATRDSLLQELFGNTVHSIGVSYLRVNIGASDLSADVYTYDDMPAGETDTSLLRFSLDHDRAAGTGLVPLLRQIARINPAIKILGSPWTAPVWMKTNGHSIGGSLKPEYYGVYARYFVRYIQAMQDEGIRIDAITPQNEPLHDGNNPSMVMTATQQADFIKNHLGPAFRAAGITTKIIVYDHNCNRPDYPLTILNDTAARAFVNGSAFHLYEGDISALSAVHDVYPDKHVYFTEQYTPDNGSFEGDFKWHIKNVIIGSMRNWSRNALEWNLANDPGYGPHTPGGCTTCKGAVTIGTTITRNVAYYIIAHASRFVPPGSVRVYSNNEGMLSSVAFTTPARKKVLLVLNEGETPVSFNIKYGERWAVAHLPAGSAGTYIW